MNSIMVGYQGMRDMLDGIFGKSKQPTQPTTIPEATLINSENWNQVSVKKMPKLTATDFDRMFGAPKRKAKLMAEAVGRVEIEISGNTAQFEAALARARQLASGLSPAQTSRLPAFANDLGKVTRATKELETGTSRLKEVFRDVASSVAAFQGPLGPIAGRINFLGSLFGRVGVAVGGFALAVAGLALVAQKSVRAFAEEEQQLLTLDAVIKSTGQSAGQTAGSLADLADAVSKTTLATDDQVRSAQTLLMTFRSVANEEFPRAIRAAQDLAAAGFGSITSASMQLGKALEDPIAGLGTLRRSGVTFSVAQKEMIRGFVETGQVLKAHAEILKVVEQQVGGAGAAQASGLTGAWHVLSESMNDAMVKAGELITKFLPVEAVIRAISAGIKTLIDDLESFSAPEAWDRFINGILSGVSFGLLGDRIKELGNQLTKTDSLVRKNVNGWQEWVAALAAFNAQAEAAKQKLEGVIVSLQKQADEARLTSLEQEVLNKANEAGVRGDKAKEEILRRLIILQRTNANVEAARLRQMDRQTEVKIAEYELSLVGKSIEQQSALREGYAEEARLRAEAAKAGIAADETDIKNAHLKAEAIAHYNQLLAETNKQLDLQFERQTAFLSDTEQKVAATMREWFPTTWQQHMEDTIARQIRFNDQLQQTYDLTRDFAGTFVDDMLEGKSAIDSVTDALKNLEKRLISMALDNVIKGLFSALSTYASGGSGSGGNVFTALLSGGSSVKTGGVYQHGGVVGSTVVPTYGGGKLAYDEYPAILHVGERVIPAGGGEPKLGISGAQMTRMFGGTPRFEGGFNAAAAAAGAYTAGDTGASGKWSTVSGGGGNVSLSNWQASQYTGSSRGGTATVGGRSSGGGTADVGGGRVRADGRRVGGVAGRGSMGVLAGANWGVTARLAGGPYGPDELTPREAIEAAAAEARAGLRTRRSDDPRYTGLDVRGTAQGGVGISNTALSSMITGPRVKTIRVPVQHQGGWVGSTPVASRLVAASIFEGAPSFQVGMGGGYSSNTNRNTVASTTSGTSSRGTTASQTASTQSYTSQRTTSQAATSSGAGAGLSASYTGSGGGGLTRSITARGGGGGGTYTVSSGGGYGGYVPGGYGGSRTYTSPFTTQALATAIPRAASYVASLLRPTAAYSRELTSLVATPLIRPGTPNVVFRQRGPEVAQWQRTLTRAGFPVAEDGVFGQETLRQTRRYELANAALTGRPIHRPTGVAGPEDIINARLREEGYISPAASTFGNVLRPRTGYTYVAPGTTPVRAATAAGVGGRAADVYSGFRTTFDPSRERADTGAGTFVGGYGRVSTPVAGAAAAQRTAITSPYRAGAGTFAGGYGRVTTPAVRYVGATGQMGYAGAGAPLPMSGTFGNILHPRTGGGVATTLGQQWSQLQGSAYGARQWSQLQGSAGRFGVGAGTMPGGQSGLRMGYPGAGRPLAYGPGIPTGTTVPYPTQPRRPSQVEVAGVATAGQRRLTEVQVGGVAITGQRPTVAPVRASRDTGGIGFGFEPTVAHQFSELQGAPVVARGYGVQPAIGSQAASDLARLSARTLTQTADTVAGRTATDIAARLAPSVPAAGGRVISGFRSPTGGATAGTGLFRGTTAAEPVTETTTPVLVPGTDIRIIGAADVNRQVAAQATERRIADATALGRSAVGMRRSTVGGMARAQAAAAQVTERATRGPAAAGQVIERLVPGTNASITAADVAAGRSAADTRAGQVTGTTTARLTTGADQAAGLITGTTTARPTTGADQAARAGGTDVRVSTTELAGRPAVAGGTPYAGVRGRARASRFSGGGAQAAMANIAARAEQAAAGYVPPTFRSGQDPNQFGVTRLRQEELAANARRLAETRTGAGFGASIVAPPTNIRLGSGTGITYGGRPINRIVPTTTIRRDYDVDYGGYIPGGFGERRQVAGIPAATTIPTRVQQPSFLTRLSTGFWNDVQKINEALGGAPAPSPGIGAHATAVGSFGLSRSSRFGVQLGPLGTENANYNYPERDLGRARATFYGVTGGARVGGGSATRDLRGAAGEDRLTDTAGYGGYIPGGYGAARTQAATRASTGQYALISGPSGGGVPDLSIPDVATTIGTSPGVSSAQETRAARYAQEIGRFQDMMTGLDTSGGRGGTAIIGGGVGTAALGYDVNIPGGEGGGADVAAYTAGKYEPGLNELPGRFGSDEYYRPTRGDWRPGMSSPGTREIYRQQSLTRTVSLGGIDLTTRDRSVAAGYGGYIPGGYGATRTQAATRGLTQTATMAPTSGATPAVAGGYGIRAVTDPARARAVELASIEQTRGVSPTERQERNDIEEARAASAWMWEPGAADRSDMRFLASMGAVGTLSPAFYEKMRGDAGENVEMRLPFAALGISGGGDYGRPLGPDRRVLAEQTSRTAEYYKAWASGALQTGAPVGYGADVRAMLSQPAMDAARARGRTSGSDWRTGYQSPAEQRENERAIYGAPIMTHYGRPGLRQSTNIEDQRLRDSSGNLMTRVPATRPPPTDMSGVEGATWRAEQSEAFERQQRWVPAYGTGGIVGSTAVPHLMVASDIFVGAPRLRAGFDSLVPVYHSGGIVGSTPVPLRMVSSSVFERAPKLQGGLSYGEVPAVLRAGETVSPSGGGSAKPTVVVNTPPAPAPVINVNVINNSSAEVTTNSQTGENGNLKLDILIDQMVSNKMRDGGSQISKTLSTMGARSAPIRR